MSRQSETTRYQLADSPFFRLSTRKKLAATLLTSEAVLDDLCSHDAPYVRRWKHKKLDDVWRNKPPNVDELPDFRPIDIPSPRLKALQTRIAVLLQRVAPPDFLFSPVKGRSYVGNAARHLGAKAFWQLDIANYFPSCSANNIARFFRRDMECAPDVTAILVRITTYQECLPQGSACSPILAYFSNMRMWLEIAAIAEAGGCTLSAYADDLTLSGIMIRKKLVWTIKQCVRKHGLRLNDAKEVSLINAPADITGVIVDGDRTRLPNRQHRKLAELKEFRRTVFNPKHLRKIDLQIAGRIAQRRQVEGNADVKN